MVKESSFLSWAHDLQGKYAIAMPTNNQTHFVKCKCVTVSILNLRSSILDPLSNDHLNAFDETPLEIFDFGFSITSCTGDQPVAPTLNF